MALLTVAGNATTFGGCGFIPRSTIPQPFVRPGAPVFYLKVERFSEKETTNYKGTSVGRIVHFTRYIAVDRATCRKMGELRINGKTREEAWDPAGDDLWFTQEASRQTRSFHGHEVRLPEIAHPGVTEWAAAGALRFAYPADAAGPVVWSFHTGRATPIPPRPAAGGSKYLRGKLYGGGRLVGVEAPSPAGTIDVIVVDPPADPDADPGVARRTLTVEDANAQAVGVARDGHAILFADQQRALELFDLADGHRLWRHTLPPQSSIAGSPSNVLVFLGGYHEASGTDSFATLDGLTGARPRQVDIREWFSTLDPVASGGFALGETYLPEPRHPIAVDTRKGLTMAVPGRPRLPTSVGGELYYVDDQSRDRLYRADFARGVTVPVEPVVDDIRFVAADPVSGTLVLTASSGDVFVYRAATGRIDKCIEP
jgi:hypothetical protein